MNSSSIVFRALVLISAACAAACSQIPVTPDTRTSEQKARDFESAISDLKGVYEVAESRNDGTFRPKTISIGADGGRLLALLVGKDDTWLLTGDKCVGNIRPISVNIFCTKSLPGVGSLGLSREGVGRGIKSGAMIGGFQPMQLKPGDVVFEYHETPSGRPHYYLLKKKATS